MKRGSSGTRGLLASSTSSILASRSLKIVLGLLLPEIFFHFVNIIILLGFN